MNEYRITRPKKYPPTSAGHKDLSAREGYYVHGENLLDALNKLKLLLSSDIIFDVETEGKYLGKFNRKGEKV